MAANRQAAIASAEKLVAKGKIDSAIKEYRKLLSDNPNDASTLNRLGDLYARIDKIDDAVRLFSQIADRYTEDGFFVKAIAIYKKIIKLDPTRLAVYERLAELYHKQGLVTEARTQYQVLVDYYQKHGNAGSAIGVLERMVELEPEDPSPHAKLAELYHQEGRSEQELAEYRTIAELMLQKGHIEEATRVYSKAITIAPLDIAFITDAVLGLKDSGHTGAAARLLAVAVERNPQAEKIARLAGIGRAPRETPAAPAPPSPPAPLTVNGVLADRGEALEKSDVLYVEPEMLEPDAALEPAPETGSPPEASLDPERPSRSLASSDAGGVDFVLDLPEEGIPPSSLIEPTEEMLHRSPQSPWYEVEAGVEFELEIEDAVEVEAEPESAPPELQEIEPGIEIEVVSEPEPEPELTPAPTPPPAASEPPAARTDQPEAPAPTELPGFGMTEEGPPIEWSFEPEPSLDLELPAASSPAEAGEVAPPEEPAAQRSGLDLDALEKTSYEVLGEPIPAQRRLEDLLAEAEVFGKYGLREKAHDRLREILQQEPKHLGALVLQVQLWLEDGRHDRVAPRVEPIAQVAAELRDDDQWPALRTRLTKAGYRFDGDRLVGGPTSKKTKKDSVASLLEDLVGFKSPTASAPRKAKIEEGPALDALAELTAQFAPSAPTRPPAPRTPPPAAPAAPPPAPEKTKAPAPPPVSPRAGDAVDEDELPDIVIPRKAPPPAAPPPEPPASAAPSADDEGLAWLDRAPTPIGPMKTADESLFDDEEGFFDLAAELEEELAGDDATGGKSLLAPQEQSLEEIVEGFKKGVAESLSPEDYDTHFNLGIAYREMGLIDEAIGEFQIAAKDATYLVDCCSLLGACFLDKGLPELAVRWYQKGLATPELSEEATLGLLYDLGNLYLSIGEQEKAHRTFVEIYGTNSNYRDVVAKLEELGGR